MQKKRLREQFKQLRQQLSPVQREQYSIDIANNSLQLPIWQFNTYHLFLTIDTMYEVQTTFLLSILQGKDKHVVVSKSNFHDASLTHFLLTDQTTFVTNKYHIPEPVGGIQIQEDQIDVVFVPLLCVDRQGHRVGYGKGFYDGFLQKCTPTTQFIGLSFFEPINELIETHEKDVPLHALVTPHDVLYFE